TSPANKVGSPSKSAAHRFKENKVSFLDPSIPYSRHKGKRDRCCRGISVTVQRDYDLLRGNTDLLGSSIENTLVGLMRNEPVDILRFKTVCGNRFFHHFRDRIDRKSEHLFALHA